MELCVGSTIIEQGGKFTFVAHPVPLYLTEIPTVQCPNWFDTMDEAMAAGSRYLDYIQDLMSDAGMVVRRAQ